MKTVRSTEEVRPPMMARAIGVYCSPPSPSFMRHGNHADDGGERCHQNGPQTHAAGGDDRVEHGHALLFQLVREIDDQNAVGICDADQHQHAHQRHDVERGVRQRQDDQHADEAHGNREHDQERIDERAELGDQNQEQQNEGDAEADARSS